MKKYLVCAGIGVQDALEYRADFLLSMVSVLSPVLVQLFLWANLFADDKGGTLFGYTFPQMLSYVLYSNIISRLIRTGFEYEINRDIKDGILSVFIVKPASYYLYCMSVFLGKKLFHTVVLLVFFIGVTVFLFFSYGQMPAAQYIVLFFASLLLSFILNYAIFFSVGMLGFWFEDIGFLFEAVRVVIIVFSGGVFPLDVFGKEVHAFLTYLPFTYTVYFPTDLLSGRLSIQDALSGLSVEFLWVVAFSLFATRLFSLGMKRFSASGG